MLEMDLRVVRAEYKYWRMACNTDLTKMKRLAKLRDLKVQLASIFSILVIRSSHVERARGLSVRGTPRYFEGSLHL